MTITFQIHYQTIWGQQIAVVGNQPELGSGDMTKAPALKYLGAGYWRLVAPFKKNPTLLEYQYVLRDENTGTALAEWGPYRQVRLPRQGADELFIKDSWRSAAHPDNFFFTQAFAEIVFKPAKNWKATPAPVDQATGQKVTFQLRLAQAPPDFQLALLGNTPELGNWDPHQPLLLDNSQYPLWRVSTVLRNPNLVEYKYGWYDPLRKQVVQLEAGPNRRLDSPNFLGQPPQIWVQDEYFQHPNGPWRGAGVAVPVFSLRSDNGLGVGEFSDLKALADWAKLAGLQLIQVLPVNDTTAHHNWQDSYPYSAISVFALHPIYLHVEDLGAKLSKTKLAAAKKKLNASPVVDFPAVMQHKLAFAREAYEQVGAQLFNLPAYQAYFVENRHWLEPYAVFSYLRDRFSSVDFRTWGDYAVYQPAFLTELADPTAPSYAAIGFYYFLQYHLDRQLREASAYAAANGIVLKGDLPIGIYRHSVDAWTAPHLYNSSGQAGAPPDPFSDNGQNWGFPTYRWEVMAQDNYAWWRLRMQHLARYFGAYRIDHILGFFRIWEIPYRHIEGLPGVFRPALPYTREDLTNLGLAFDWNRWVRPYITSADLAELFGEHRTLVEQHFLDQQPDGSYHFKDVFKGQRDLAAYLEETAKGQDLGFLRPGLFELMVNVLMLEDPDQPHDFFHPRIQVEKTRSFRQLPYEQQQRLRALHDDYFYHRHEEFWRQQAMQKLPALRASTNMLICGEDLGMVPATVPGVMKELEILSLEIQRMSKNPATEFLQPQDIPYAAVCSPSTHDMATVRGWWVESEPAQIQRFWERELHRVGPAPAECTTEVARAILEQHLRWPAMWTIFPLQDLLAVDDELRHPDPASERINVPADPNHRWCYRCHLTLDELQKATAFNQYLQQSVDRNGRN